MDGAGTVLAEIVLMAVTFTLICRWVFGDKGVRRGVQRPDYGLLCPVLRTDTLAQAEAARDDLATVGIRATIAAAGAGFTASGHAWPAEARVVLVFPPDLAGAESLLRPTPSR